MSQGGKKVNKGGREARRQAAVERGTAGKGREDEIGSEKVKRSCILCSFQR